MTRKGRILPPFEYRTIGLPARSST